jgi:tRNA-2-methylthio-N6-dimethylallyladenosine synthase
MNKSDSERIAAALEKRGGKPASSINRADLIVTNMCSVRQSAVDRIFGLSRKFSKLKAQNPKLRTILTGCILQKDKRKFREIFDEIKQMPKGSCPSALIPISNGCNNRCTYCVVPQTRGPLVCRDHKKIIKEFKQTVKKGFREIWLLGQNVNDYTSPIDSSITEPRRGEGRDEGKLQRRQTSSIDFAELLKVVSEIPGNFSIRFTSPNPKNFSDELIDVMANSPKIAKYLNLPVQSGDNKVLRAMNRPYSVEKYKELVKKIRRKMPDINLSTDVIVGFPGETKKQFENTVKLFKEIKFNIAYISKYSPRPGTAAFKMKDNIPWKEKKRREKCLRKLLQS